jgi:tryptophanyl-tRNA synthetase
VRITEVDLDVGGEAEFAVPGHLLTLSRNNAIPIGATADETARLISRAKTDSDRRIICDPVNRLEVFNLLLLAALCLNRKPESIAEEASDGGAAGLKRLVTEAVNEHFREIRQRRAELVRDRGTDRFCWLATSAPTRLRARPLPTSGD